jgi:hypothetical protein
LFDPAFWRLDRRSIKGVRRESPPVSPRLLPANAQTKPDRTRREQPGEIGACRTGKKSSEIR